MITVFRPDPQKPDVLAMNDLGEQNYTLEEFLECFPSVTREIACKVLERSESALLAPTAA